MSVLQPLEEVNVGSGWRVWADPKWNEPNTYLDIESDIVERDGENGPVFILTAVSDLWSGDFMNLGLTLEGAVGLIVALEREIARVPANAEEAARLMAALES